MRSSMIFALIACHGLAACSGGGGDGGGVTEPPNYSISLTLDRSSESTIPGGGFSVTGTLTRAGGYAGTVTFSIEGAPAGIDATVGNPVTSGSATTLSIAVTVGTSVAPGTYPIVARGRGAGVSDATATFTLTVLPTPEFALAISPGAASLVQGASQSDVQVSVARTNFDGAVTLAVSSSVPAGVSASFSPPSPTGATASMTLQVASSTVPGIYTLTIQGTGAPGVRTATFALTVVAAPDFSLAIQPATVTIVQGLSRPGIGVEITRTNFTGAVALALAGAVPAGVTASFTPASATGNGTQMTLTVAGSTAVGSYELRVDGTGAPGTRSVTFTLNVTAPGSFALAITPSSAVVVQQGTADNSRTVTITRTNYAADVTLSVENLPNGLTATFDPNPVSGNSAVLTLTASNAIAPGGSPYFITIRGTGPIASVRGAAVAAADVEATVTLEVTVTPAGTFTLSMPAPCAANFQIRQRALDDRRIVRINRTNFAGPITFALEGLPNGLTAGFDANPVTGNAVRLRLFAAADAPGGDYPVTLRGTSGGTEATLLLNINVHVVSDPFDQNAVSWEFTNADAGGWLRGVVCPFPQGAQTHVDWGIGIFQENMIVMDGRGPASNRLEANAWLTRTVTLPPDASLFRINASGHFLNDARTRVRVRVVDGAVSTVVLEQVITGSWPVRVFQTLDANIAPWAGRTVRIFVEQLDEIASHGQLWLDTFRIIGSP